MSSEEQLQKWLLEKIKDIVEKVSVFSNDACPFCCQPELLNEDTEEYNIDHYDDCLITVLDSYYLKIRDNGLW